MFGLLLRLITLGADAQRKVSDHRAERAEGARAGEQSPTVTPRVAGSAIRSPTGARDHRPQREEVLDVGLEFRDGRVAIARLCLHGLADGRSEIARDAQIA